MEGVITTLNIRLNSKFLPEGCPRPRKWERVGEFDTLESARHHANQRAESTEDWLDYMISINNSPVLESASNNSTRGLIWVSVQSIRFPPA